MISKINIWKNLGKFLVIGIVVQAIDGHKFDSKFTSKFSPVDALNTSTEATQQFPSAREESSANQSKIFFSSNKVTKQDQILQSRKTRSVEEDYQFDIEMCSTAIRNGLIDKAVSFFIISNNATLLPEIIRKSYYSLSDAENILKFVRGLPKIHQSSIGYSALFEQMTAKNKLNSYQLIQLAFKVKETMNMLNYPNIDQSYKNKMANLKSSLPSNVRNLVWSDRNSCTIKNVNYNEYLYMANDYFDYDAFTWVPGNRLTNGDWKIVNLGDSGYFLLKNIEKNRYLSTSSNSYDVDRRYIKSFSSGSNDDLKWRLYPKDGYFMMKNHHYGQYLFASSNKYDGGNDNQRRVVYTWRKNHIPDSILAESKWEIHCDDYALGMFSSILSYFFPIAN